MSPTWGLRHRRWIRSVPTQAHDRSSVVHHAPDCAGSEMANCRPRNWLSTIMDAVALGHTAAYSVETLVGWAYPTMTPLLLMPAALLRS